MVIDLLLCHVTEEATQPSPLSDSGGVIFKVGLVNKERKEKKELIFFQI